MLLYQSGSMAEYALTSRRSLAPLTLARWAASMTHTVRVPEPSMPRHFLSGSNISFSLRVAGGLADLYPSLEAGCKIIAKSISQSVINSTSISVKQSNWRNQWILSINIVALTVDVREYQWWLGSLRFMETKGSVTTPSSLFLANLHCLHMLTLSTWEWSSSSRRKYYNDKFQVITCIINVDKKFLYE